MSPISRKGTSRPSNRSGFVITQETVDQVRAGIILMGLTLGLLYDRVPVLRPLFDAAFTVPAATPWRGPFDPEVAHVP